MATKASDWEKRLLRQKADDIAKANQSYDTAADAARASVQRQKDLAAQQRDTALETQKREYRDLHDQAAVQEYLNRQKTNEAMANSGLSDSGLNRTQQTAVSLVRGNQDAQLSRQQQDARDATFQAYNEMVAQYEAEGEKQRLANEQARQAQLLNIENTYGDTIANLYKEEAAAQQVAAKQLAEQQKAMQDAYLKLLDKTGDEAEADHLMQKLYGVSVGGGQAQTGTGATAKTYTTTDGSTVNTPFSQMTFKKTKNTWNGPAGLGSLFNAIGGGNVGKGMVKQGVMGNVDWNDEFYLDGSYFADGKGRTMTTSAIEKELLNEGMSKAEARRMLLELTNLKESDTYTDGKATDYKLQNIQKKVSGGQMDQMDAAEEIMKLYSTSPDAQIEAMMSVGMSRAGAQAAQRAYKTYMQN